MYVPMLTLNPMRASREHHLVFYDGLSTLTPPTLHRHWDVSAVCNGVLCGTVAITAACGLVDPW